jgi:hypothetical protein
VIRMLANHKGQINPGFAHRAPWRGANVRRHVARGLGFSNTLQTRRLEPCTGHFLRT